MNELFEQFVAEARELVAQVSDDLVAAEREGLSEERIDRVFRAFHTLKGSAGVVDLPPMGLVLHAAEDVLSAVQSGRIGGTPTLIDQLLAAVDQVAHWVDDFDAHQTLPADADDIARKLTVLLRSFVGIEAAGAAPPSVRAPAGVALPDWVATMMASDRFRRRLQEPVQCVAFSYQPREGCFFDGDDPLALVRRVPNLLAVNVESLTSKTLAEADPYTCNLRLEGISAAPRSDLADVFRLVPDQVSFVVIPADAFAAALDHVDEDPAQLARVILGEQAEVLRAAPSPQDLVGRAGSAVRVSVSALTYANRADLVAAMARAGAETAANATPAPLLKAIDAALTALASPARSDADDGSLKRPAQRASRSFRVEETRVDALVDLAGELLVAAHGFGHLAMRAEQGRADSQELARAIRERKEALERLAGDIHASVLQLRMVPVAQVLRSFPRIVRDLSQKLGKEVQLVTLGETIESDKTIVDLMFEPLMHLVRNAVDHGIETPPQRRQLGKDLPAKISLQASRAGDRLLVEVVDDGRGIDPEAVRRKAGEMGLMPAEELASLSDQQAINLIFAAGFSTAAEVSDVSGRGVGMDVVRATIERIGGRVSLKSEPGAGTAVSLDFPMNIALLRIMVIETAGQVLGIPMDAVLETVRLPPERISRIKVNEGFVLHDRVVPICSLAELLGLSQRVPGRGERLLVVAEIGGRVIALEVDAVRERLEVVLKPMQGLLSKARGYAGTTLLGDGTVLLVLDLRDILS